MQKLLSHKPERRRLDTRRAAAYAAGLRKVSTWRIGWEMLRLSNGRGGLRPEDYFLFGAWQPGLSWRERLAFVGTNVSVALNASLNPPLNDAERQRTDNKLVTASVCAAAGLPQSRITAVVSAESPIGGHRWLDSPDAVKSFLREPGALPGFGKPVSGRAGEGGVSLIALEGPDHIRLGSGSVVPIAELAEEIWRDFPDGYLFQELIRPHPALAALIGPVIGTLRVVTIDAGSGPEPLYTSQKVPAAGAMVDTGAGPLGCFAAVDLKSGRVLRLQDRRQIGGTDLSHFPQTGAPVVGTELPDFAEAVQLAVLAHKAIGDRGMLGMDILLSDRGPVVNEVNQNPGHSAFQAAFARGLLNDDFMPKLQAVRARYRAVTPHRKPAPLP